MCFNCPDFVAYCDAEGCYNPDGGPYSRLAKFYVGDQYCEHLAPRYGHDVATWGDAYPDDSEPTVV